ncbi:hypothetical protein [Maribacter sp. R77961]|uniref:hypothetical protein n=1 Tax=Maribacter sp. R77961 TaxID=3093871 RepID=UPI0037CBC78C
MKKNVLILFILIAFQSCIPIRIPPKIKDYQLTKGKRFKRSLPKRQMFVFEDPKEANEFYNYVNTKFKLEHIDVYDNIPFSLANKQFFFSFYEVDIPNKTINLIPIAVDAILQNSELDPIMDGLYETRKGNWYIAIEVYSDMEYDCLHPNSVSRPIVSEFLRSLKNEYLASYNYNEAIFKN